MNPVRLNRMAVTKYAIKLFVICPLLKIIEIIRQKGYALIITKKICRRRV
jgi:hypothetical protein